MDGSSSFETGVWRRLGQRDWGRYLFESVVCGGKGNPRRAQPTFAGSLPVMPPIRLDAVFYRGERVVAGRSRESVSRVAVRLLPLWSSVSRLCSRTSVPETDLPRGLRIRLLTRLESRPPRQRTERTRPRGPTIPTTRSVRSRRSGIVSPTRQFGTALLIVGGSLSAGCQQRNRPRLGL